MAAADPADQKFGPASLTRRFIFHVVANIIMFIVLVGYPHF
jgi:hypothetical protein